MKNSEFYTTDAEREDAFREYMNGMTFGNHFACASKAIEWMNAESEGVHKVYDGMKIRIFGWSLPVVIDLTGCRTLGGNMCDLLTTSDDNEHAKNLGKCRVVIGADGIYAKTDRAKATGYSVGVEVEMAERIDKGYREINGRAIFAPFYHVTKSVLKEVMETPDENKVSLTTKSDEVVELEKSVADLECENKKLQKYNHSLKEQLALMNKACRDVKQKLADLGRSLSLSFVLLEDYVKCE